MCEGACMCEHVYFLKFIYVFVYACMCVVEMSVNMLCILCVPVFV